MKELAISHLQKLFFYNNFQSLTIDFFLIPIITSSFYLLIFTVLLFYAMKTPYSSVKAQNYK